jgi:hypothetical protein
VPPSTSRRAVRRAIRCVSLAVVLACALVLSGCGVRLQASHLVVRIDGTGMHLVQVNGSPAGGDRRVPSGETVIEVINADPKLAHTVMLVRGFGTPAALPASVRTARLTSDDPERILEMSVELDKDQIQVSATGGVIDDPKNAQFPDYLAAGEKYMLVDAAHIDRDFLVVDPQAAA